MKKTTRRESIQIKNCNETTKYIRSIRMIKTNTTMPAKVSENIPMLWKHFPHYWPFVCAIHRLPVDSLTLQSCDIFSFNISL